MALGSVAQLLTTKNDNFSAGLQKLNLYHKNKPWLRQRYGVCVRTFLSHVKAVDAKSLLSKPQRYGVYQKHTKRDKKWMGFRCQSIYILGHVVCGSSKAVPAARKLSESEVREYNSQRSGLPHEARKFKPHTRYESSRVEQCRLRTPLSLLQKAMNRRRKKSIFAEADLTNQTHQTRIHKQRRDLRRNVFGTKDTSVYRVSPGPTYTRTPKTYTESPGRRL